MMKDQKPKLTWWSLYLPIIMLTGLLALLIHYDGQSMNQRLVGLSFLVLTFSYTYYWITANTAAIIWDDFDRWKRGTQLAARRTDRFANELTCNMIRNGLSKHAILKTVVWLFVAISKVINHFQ